MKITFLGTCSGTEPMPNMHQTSFVIEIGNAYYWFDAGEGCGYTAYTHGIDVTRVRALFISHVHIDHVGGLPHLIFTMNKVEGRYGLSHINDGNIDVFIPNPKTLEAALYLANDGRLNHGNEKHSGVNMIAHRVCDGVAYEDENVKITALHSTHIKGDGENGEWNAFSYLIEADGKRVIYSGDVGSPTDFDALIGDGCDLLIMENGHHKISDVLDYMQERKIKKLLFNHHGREMIADRAAAKQKITERGLNADICYDGMIQSL